MLDDGLVSFAAGPANAPRMAVVSNGALQGPAPSGILHGIVAHPDLHNPFMFRVRVAKPTRFDVVVGNVSGEGGARLVVTLDGAEAVNKEFPDPDWKTNVDDLRQYAGTYSVNLSPGVHTIVVENKGVDWMRVGYRIEGVVPRTKPPLSAWAVVGDGTAMAWVRLSGRSWRTVALEKIAVHSAPPSVLRLRGLRSGTWRTEVWDTWGGRPPLHRPHQGRHRRRRPRPPPQDRAGRRGQAGARRKLTAL